MLMFVNVNFVFNQLRIFPVHSKYFPSIVQVIITRELVIAFVQIEIQNQVLVVQVSVTSVSYETNAVKQGIISGLTD